MGEFTAKSAYEALELPIQCCRECVYDRPELAELEPIGEKLLCPNCGHVYEDVSEGGEA